MCRGSGNRTDDPRDEDPEQVEPDHRRREDTLGDHVAARRDYGGRDEDNQDRVLEVPQEEQNA